MTRRAESGTAGSPPQRLALIAITRRGALLAGRLAAAWPHAEAFALARWQALAGPSAQPIHGRLAAAVPALLARYDGLVFFSAVGIAVRLVAPHLRDKWRDPAVVAVDEAGRWVVSVLAGHAGGGNALAAAVAAVLGAQAVITTASEARGLLSLEALAAAHGWRLALPAPTARVSAALVNGEQVGWVVGAPVGAAAGQPPWACARFADIGALAAAGCPGVVISDRLLPAALAPLAAERWVVLRPPTLVLGVGASRGASADEIEELARRALSEAGFAWESVGLVATLDRKLAEPGVVAFAARHRLPLRGYPAATLAAVVVPHPSAAVGAAVGTPSVAEAAALLAAGGPLVVPKQKGRRVTVAVARREA
jgi:cobalamin biosynthesis protein CbiG